MSRQTQNVPFRGNPEQKLIKTRDDFSGGINMRDSDDLMTDNEVRYAYNLSIDEQGDIKSRNGWERAKGVDLLISMADENDFDIGLNSPVANLEPVKRKGLHYTHDINITPMGSIPVLSKGEKFYIEGTASPYHFTTHVYIMLYKGEESVRLLSNKLEFNSYYAPDNGNYLIINEDFSQYVTDTGEVMTAKVVYETYYHAQVELVDTVFRVDIWREKPDGKHNDTVDILAFEIIENKNNLWEAIVSNGGGGVLPNYNEEDGVFSYIMVRRRARQIEIIAKKYIYTKDEGLKLGSKKTVNLQDITDPHSFDEENFSRRLDRPLQLTSVDVGRDGNRLFITVNDEKASNLVSILYNMDSPEVGELFSIKYYGKVIKKDVVNSAYKPTPQEIRHVGFNMLGDVPLTWVDSGGLKSNSIQGVFLTNKDKNIPLNIIPMSNKFKLYVMYTGDIGSKQFGIKFFEVVGYDEEAKAPKRNEIKAEITKHSSSSAGMYVVDVQLKTSPTQEVELEVEFPDDVNVGKYYDYYHPGAEDPEAEEVRSLNIGDFKISQVWDRFVYYNKNTMWYNDINRPDYIPNFNYIKLPLDADDEITGIIYFRSAYIIFTRKKIFKMQGNFVEGVAVTLVNDTLGCISPNSIKMVGNKLIFLSGHGLFSLKSELFRQDLENVERLDEMIPDVIPRNSHAFSYVTGDEYVLLLNNQRPRLQNPNYYTQTNVLSRKFRTPDVVRYYTETEAVMFDVYNNKFPWFIFEFNGQIFGIAEGGIYKEGTGTLDFDEPIPVYLETQGMDFDYPTHEKKYKKMTIKLGSDSFLEDITFDFYVDGNHSYEKIKWNSHLHDEIDLANSRHLIERVRIPSRKGKNLAIIMTANTKKQVSLKALSFEYKLGKIRE